MTDRWIINGQQATAVAADDRGLHYGDGLFETIAVRAGTCRFLDDHLQRLADGCRRLKIPVPETGSLHAHINAAIEDARHGVLKIIVTRGAGKRGYAPPVPANPTLMVGFTATGFRPTAALRVRMCETRLASSPLLGGCKTLNRLEQVMARAEWDSESSGIAEGLMLNQTDQVVCGTMSNVFLVTGGALVTPPVERAGVSGVMRKQVLRLAAAMGIAVDQRYLTRQDLEQADGLFLTNALMGIAPVSELDGRSCPQASLTGRLRAALADTGVAECGA